MGVFTTELNTRPKTCTVLLYFYISPLNSSRGWDNERRQLILAGLEHT